jgi:hyaluronan synthase
MRRIAAVGLIRPKNSDFQKRSVKKQTERHIGSQVNQNGRGPLLACFGSLLPTVTLDLDDLPSTAPTMSKEPPDETLDAADLLLKTAIVLGLVVLLYFAISGRIFRPLFDGASANEWTRAIARPSAIWIIMGTMLLGFRTVLLFRYRAAAAAEPLSAPMLTVIIPAYNEGAMVGQTVDSIAQADYPRDRLEIFVVDDGSRDDTWEHIVAAAKRHPHLVTPLRFPENRGKRAALEAGFVRARGEVVVTIDSDSVIEPQTLLELAGPFRNPQVGAVAGKVLAYNRRNGIIPRMLHVRYTLSFDMLRAVQSTYGTVYCCPGALSAYRLSAVNEVLERWRHQTFLGVPCTFGEDRALTNLILELGMNTVYQRNAVVHTIVPETYGKLAKMYLRWERSYVREEWKFVTRVLWRRPWRTRWISMADAFFTNMRFPMIYVSLLLLVTLALTDPLTVLRVMVAIGVMATFYMLYYLRSEKSMDFIYGVAYAYFAFFTLFWIFPYAVVTVRARSWLTR